jgi:hypothetical protein
MFHSIQGFSFPSSVIGLLLFVQTLPFHASAYSVPNEVTIFINDRTFGCAGELCRTGLATSLTCTSSHGQFPNPSCTNLVQECRCVEQVQLATRALCPAKPVQITVNTDVVNKALTQYLHKDSVEPSKVPANAEDLHDATIFDGRSPIEGFAVGYGEQTKGPGRRQIKGTKFQVATNVFIFKEEDAMLSVNMVYANSEKAVLTPDQFAKFKDAFKVEVDPVTNVPVTDSDGNYLITGFKFDATSLLRSMLDEAEIANPVKTIRMNMIENETTKTALAKVKIMQDGEYVPLPGGEYFTIPVDHPDYAAILETPLGKLSRRVLKSYSPLMDDTKVVLRLKKQDDDSETYYFEMGVAPDNINNIAANA